MTLEVYYLKRMANSHFRHLEAFVRFTALGRFLARNATYTALMAIFAGISVLSW